jgi:hypothetical protein
MTVYVDAGKSTIGTYGVVDWCCIRSVHRKGIEGNTSKALREQVEILGTLGWYVCGCRNLLDRLKLIWREVTGDASHDFFRKGHSSTIGSISPY